MDIFVEYAFKGMVGTVCVVGTLLILLLTAKVIHSIYKDGF